MIHAGSEISRFSSFPLYSSMIHFKLFAMRRSISCITDSLICAPGQDARNLAMKRSLNALTKMAAPAKMDSPRVHSRTSRGDILEIWTPMQSF